MAFTLDDLDALMMIDREAGDGPAAIQSTGNNSAAPTAAPCASRMLIGNAAVLVSLVDGLMQVAGNLVLPAGGLS